MISNALPKMKRQAASQNEKVGEITAQVDECALLQMTIDKLQSEKDSLANTVSDLRQLISRLSVEHAKEAENHFKSVRDYEQRIKRLVKAANAAEVHAGHFDDMKDFWGEFL